MTAWETVFRNGFLPSMTIEEIKFLREGCVKDDDRLRQGSTTSPPPMMCVQDWRCEGGCAIGFASMVRPGITVGEAETYFARLCYETDKRLGEPAVCRYFLNWFDDGARDDVFNEVVRAIDEYFAEARIDL